jgi:hypothetical protein
VKSLIPDNSRHWSHYQSGGFGMEPNWEDTFLSLALQYNLCSYVQGKIDGTPGLVREKPGRPLLDYVFRHFEKQIAYGENLKMAKLLFKHGGSPNEVYDQGTIWERELRALYDIEQAHRRKKHFLRRYRFLQLLVEYGADPSAQLAIPDPGNGTRQKRTVLWLLNHVLLREWDLEETEELKAMLIKRGAKPEVQHALQPRRPNVFRRLGKMLQ